MRFCRSEDRYGNSNDEICPGMKREDVKREKKGLLHVSRLHVSCLPDGFEFRHSNFPDPLPIAGIVLLFPT
jgi:hypothetical protein